jgi:hypothetical protein
MMRKQFILATTPVEARLMKERKIEHGNRKIEKEYSPLLWRGGRGRGSIFGKMQFFHKRGIVIKAFFSAQ